MTPFLRCFAPWILGLSLVLSPAHAEDEPPLRPIREFFGPQGNFPADRFFKVAVVQWNPRGSAPLGASPAQVDAYRLRNLQDMEVRIRAAASQRAEYISLSEFAVTGYPDIPELPSADDNFRNREDVRPFVESIPGPSTDYIARLARELRVWIQFGLATREPSDAYFNSAIVIDPNGRIVANYAKQNLYQKEGDYLSAGNRIVTFMTPAGKFGLLICADVYDPRVLNQYARERVDVLSLSTSWAEQNTGMGYFQAAARQTRAFLLAANQTYFPDSGVVNPDGRNQSHIRQSRDAIAYGFLPRKF